ncbi:unnamed protein product, partial [Prorocentrum cordatum]
PRPPHRFRPLSKRRLRNKNVHVCLCSLCVPPAYAAVCSSAFEDAVQALRLRRLAELFEAVAQVRFAPSECTLQDRCLVAGAAPLPEGILAHGEASRDGGFLRRLRAGAAELLADGGPMDCRPKGLKSAKYDFDYTRRREITAARPGEPSSPRRDFPWSPGRNAPQERPGE